MILTMLLLAAGAATPHLPHPDPLVEVKKIVPGVVVHLRYATRNNFMHQRVYPKDARCLLRRSVAERLGRVEAHLEKAGYRLKLWDCYRPRSVQWKMWKLVPTPGLVANPRYGSNHNRGTAVDCTLVTLAGKPVEMPTDLDSFTRAAHRDVVRGIPKAALTHRRILQKAMRAEGFTTIRMEWWHFNAPHARRYPIADVPLVEKR